MNPIYKPKGKAAEYGDYALNIYTGCPHGCFYCYAPNVLHRDRTPFNSCVEPRRDIVEETRKQLEREHITGKLIHLCFTCDPYPTGYDTTVTREIIKLLKEYGNFVQILTKGDGQRDFDLLDENDWYGITYSGLNDNTKQSEAEPHAIPPVQRLATLIQAHCQHIKTWISLEPVIDADSVLKFLDCNLWYIDQFKIGKLNYHKSEIDWAEFGRKAEKICIDHGYDYYIKDSLRAEMEAAG